MTLLDALTGGKMSKIEPQLYRTRFKNPQQHGEEAIASRPFPRPSQRLIIDVMFKSCVSFSRVLGGE